VGPSLRRPYRRCSLRRVDRKALCAYHWLYSFSCPLHSSHLLERGRRGRTLLRRSGVAPLLALLALMRRAGGFLGFDACPRWLALRFSLCRFLRGNKSERSTEGKVLAREGLSKGKEIRALYKLKGTLSFWVRGWLFFFFFFCFFFCLTARRALLPFGLP